MNWPYIRDGDVSRTALAAGREQATHSQLQGSREPQWEKSRNRQPGSYQASGVSRVRGKGARRRVDGAGGAGCAHDAMLPAALPRGDRWSRGGGWALVQSPKVLSPRG